MNRIALLLVCISFAVQDLVKAQENNVYYGISMDFQNGNLYENPSDGRNPEAFADYSAQGIGLIIEKKLSKNFSLSLEPRFQISTYNFDPSLVLFPDTKRKEEIHVPLYLNFEFKVSKVHPIFSIGYGLTILNAFDQEVGVRMLKNHLSLMGEMGFGFMIQKIIFCPFIGYEHSIISVMEFSFDPSNETWTPSKKRIIRFGLKVSRTLFENKNVE